MAEKRKRSLPAVSQKKIKLSAPQKLPEVDNTRKEINKLFSKLISKDVRDTEKLTQKILGLLGADLLSASKKHDLCRVLQACLKLGSDTQKALIFSKVKDDFIELASGKYSYFLATKLLKYGNKEELMETVLVNAKKMLSSPFAVRFLENMYVDGGFKARILHSLLGKEVNGVYSSQSINDLKSLVPIKRILSKNLLDNTLVMHIVYLYTTVMDDSEKLELYPSLYDKFESLFKSRHGTILAVHALASSDTKQRKLILKTVQAFVPKISDPESHAYLFFIKLILVVDDTKRVNKMISLPLIHSMKQLVTSNTGAKFLSNISPFNNTLGNLSPNELKVIEESLNTTSKKSAESKKKEVFAYVFQMLSREVASNLEAIIVDARLNSLVLTVAQGIWNKVGNCVEFVQKCTACMINWDIMDSSVGHRILKRLVESEKETESKVLTKGFLKILKERKDYIEKLVKSRGVWVLVSLAEKSSLKNKCRKVLMSVKGVLSAEKSGEKALLDLLNNKN